MLGGGLGGGGGLFGQQTPQTGLGGGLGLGQGAGLGSGLGGTNASGGLFGNRPTGGLFSTATSQGGLGGGGLFGQTPQSQTQGTGGLFGNPTFGAGGGLGTGTIAGGLFQTPAQGGLGTQQRTGGLGGGGLFGQSPALGGGGGGTGLQLSGGGGLFPTSQQSSLFKSGTPGIGGATGGLFGGGGLGGGLAAQGTPVKFEPVKSTDTVIKNGLQQQVNTLLQCTTAMPQYDSKSLEELRFEDYVAGRKGPTGGMVGGGGLFSTQTGALGLAGGGNLAGGLGGGGLFGQQNKTLGGLGAGGGGLFGGQQQQQQQQQQSLGGGGLFGTQQKPGGGLFGNTPGQSKGLGGLGGGLGTGGGLFSQQQASQGGGLFGNTGGGLFSQAGQQTGLGGLGGQPQLGGGLFGNKTQPGLGQGGLGVGLGGLSGGATSLGLGGLGGLQTSQQSGLGGGLFNRGAGQMGGLGTGLSLGQSSQAGQLGGGLSLGGGLGGGGLGTGLGASGLGGLGIGQNRLGGGGTGLLSTGGGLGMGNTQLGTGIGGQTSANMNQSQLQTLTAQQQQAQLQQQLDILANSPFGDSPLFRSAISDAAKHQRTKNGSTPLTTKTTATVTPHYKLNMRPTAKFHPISLSSPSRHQDKQRLFEGLEDSMGGVGGETFVPRNKSIKKLNIKPKPTQPGAPLPDSTTPPHKAPGLTPISSPPPEESVPAAAGSPPPTNTPSPRKAFLVTSPPTADPLNESVESPELTLGTSYTNPLRKPKPQKPNPPRLDSTYTKFTGQGTPPTAASAGHMPSPDSATDTGDSSPVKLTRDPLRGHGTEEESCTPPHRPSGIVLMQVDYYTIPPLDEIDSLESEGKCEVEGFTIGRRGLGEIHFPGKTDVHGMNLDELVSIGHKEVAVYPDDVDKPPIGEGLNKHAVVILEGNWPVCKTTREPIRDAERLRSMNYVEKLRRNTAKMGATFLDYIPETGACVFEVEHFSKYKLGEDESDGEEDEGEAKSGSVIKKPKTAEAGQGKRAKELNGSTATQKTGQTGQVTINKTGQTGQVAIDKTGLITSRMLRLDDGDEKMSDDEQFEDAMSNGVGLADTFFHPLPPPSQQLASTMGLNTHHIQVMKASFFGSGKAPSHPPPSSAPLTYTADTGRPSLNARPGSKPNSRLDNYQTHLPLLNKDVFGAKASSHLLYNPISTPDQSFVEQRHERMDRGGKEAFGLSGSRGPVSVSGAPFQSARSLLQAPSAALMVKHNLCTLVPLNKSLIRGQSRMVADTSLFMGRSFRVGWGPNWTLAHSGFRITPNSQTSSTGHLQQPLFTTPSSGTTALLSSSSSSNLALRVVVERLDVSPFTKPELLREGGVAPLFVPYLGTQLAHTNIDILESGVPHCAPQDGNELLHAFADVARQQTATTDGDVLTREQMRLVLQLAVALWGDLPMDCDPDPSSYNHQVVRKRALSRWLMDSSRAAISQEIAGADNSESNYLTALFSLVSGRQLSAACSLAHRHRDHHLSLLLSQATHNTLTTRALLRQQLSEWERLKAHLHINTERMRVYVVLAGLMVWEAYDCHVNVCEGLDWKRTLALHLWYHCQPSAPFRDALEEYMQAFQSEEAYAPPPLPPYLEAHPAPKEEVFDTCYHLLRLYCSRDHSLELTLGPSTSTPYQLDYRIRLSQLHTSFASQLESSGQWQWAVFVLLHLEDPVLCRCAVQEVLSRHCSEEEELTPSETFVINQLKVPEEWVYEAKALLAQYNQSHDLQALHLLRGGQWNDAHTVIIDHLVADMIINAETQSLLEMLEQLSDRSSEIQNWSCAGSVYLDFLHISDKLEEFANKSAEVTSCELEELHVGLCALTHRIDQVPCRSPKECLCQAEMAKRTVSYTKLVSSLKSSFDSEGYSTRGIVLSLTQLPMPSDYTHSVYQTLLHPHILELEI